MKLTLQTNRRLSEFSTFGIGGPIRLFTEIHTIEEMQEAWSLPHPKLVVGKGSNCLFPDEGFDGLVLLNKIDYCHWNATTVEVGAGYSFSLLGVQSARKGFSGLEFASGIPASVGGAVFMNAGANGKETSDVLESVLYFDGEKKHLSRKDLQFSYRSSEFQKKSGVILGAVFQLSLEETARANQLKILDHRMKTQPLKEKSAGCIFRNPIGKSAGALIETCGLKGMSVGGAKVSEVHANFIINAQNARASEVKELIRKIQQKVQEQTGVWLESEVRIIDGISR